MEATHHVGKSSRHQSKFCVENGHLHEAITAVEDCLLPQNGMQSFYVFVLHIMVVYYLYSR